MRTSIRNSGLPIVIWLGSLVAPALSAPAQKSQPVAPANLGPGLYAIIQTSMGTMTAELFERQTPNTVRNFVGLATGTRPWLDPKSRKMVARPLYDNITFHRVIPDFMIQTGDPTGTGAHNCGFDLPDEIVGGLTFDRPGRLAMANIGKPNTGACQFFITEKPFPSGNGKYTIFGQLVDGQEVVTKIAHVIRDDQDKPRFPIKLIHVAIIRRIAAPELTQSGAGSGFYVNAAGDILTSSEVVRECKETRLPDGGRLQLAVSDPRNGLAVLHSGKKTESFAVFRGGDGVASGESVSAGGAAATVSAAADAHGDQRFFQLTTPPQPAAFGSPILDSSGKLVGVLRGPAEGAPAAASVAVQATVALGFLESAGVAVMPAAAAPASSPAASSYTVQLQCWK